MNKYNLPPKGKTDDIVLIDFFNTVTSLYSCADYSPDFPQPYRIEPIHLSSFAKTVPYILLNVNQTNVYDLYWKRLACPKKEIDIISRK